MDNTFYVIKFLNGGDYYYIASWADGDPPRTYNIENALKFIAKPFAESAAKRIINKYPERYKSNAVFEIVSVNYRRINDSGFVPVITQL